MGVFISLLTSSPVSQVETLSSRHGVPWMVTRLSLLRHTTLESTRMDIVQPGISSRNSYHYSSLRPSFRPQTGLSFSNLCLSNANPTSSRCQKSFHFLHFGLRAFYGTLSLNIIAEPVGQLWWIDASCHRKFGFRVRRLGRPYWSTQYLPGGTFRSRHAYCVQKSFVGISIELLLAVPDPGTLSAHGVWRGASTCGLPISRSLS